MASSSSSSSTASAGRETMPLATRQALVNLIVAHVRPHRLPHVIEIVRRLEPAQVIPSREAAGEEIDLGVLRPATLWALHDAVSVYSEVAEHYAAKRAEREAAEAAACAAAAEAAARAAAAVEVEVVAAEPPASLFSPRGPSSSSSGGVASALVHIVARSNSAAAAFARSASMAWPGAKLAKQESVSTLGRGLGLELHKSGSLPRLLSSEGKAGVVGGGGSSGGGGGAAASAGRQMNALDIARAAMQMSARRSAEAGGGSASGGAGGGLSSAIDDTGQSSMEGGFSDFLANNGERPRQRGRALRRSDSASASGAELLSAAARAVQASAVRSTATFARTNSLHSTYLGALESSAGGVSDLSA